MTSPPELRLNSIRSNGLTPLTSSILNHDPYFFVKWLVMQGADVNIGSSDMYPIHAAVITNQLDVVELLFLNGANPDQTTKDMSVTPLIIAAYQGNYEMVQKLVENGADINHQTKSGVTALHFAANKNHMNIVYFLRFSKANLMLEDELGRTPIDVAGSDAREFLQRSVAREILIGSALKTIFD